MLMDLPSYDEARQHPRTPGPGVLHMPPPPTYDASMSSPPPSTPPPSYGEAVEFEPNHFPVLSVPMSLHQNTGVFIHPTIDVPVVVSQSVSVTQSSPVVIYQPQPVPLVVPCHLTDSPALVQCSHCGRTGTTKVTNVPNGTAWCLCVLLSLMGLVCGFCLIPLFAKGFQEAHHSCPHCDQVVHVYKR